MRVLGPIAAAIALLTSGLSAEAQNIPPSPLEQRVIGWSIDDITSKLGAPKKLVELGSFQFATYSLMICQGASCQHVANCDYEFKMERANGKVAGLRINVMATGPSSRVRDSITANMPKVCAVPMEKRLALE